MKDILKADTLVRALFETFRTKGGETAMVFLRDGQKESEYSYQDMYDHTRRMAGILDGLGVRKGDRVMLLMEKEPFFLFAHLAAQAIGAVSVPLNPLLTEHELSFLVPDCSPCLVICGDSAGRVIDRIGGCVNRLIFEKGREKEIWASFGCACGPELTNIELLPEQTALIIYTSGTTGRPKGAMLTHKNLLHDAQKVMSAWEIGESDTICHALPIFHVHGLCFALHTPLLAGAGVIMLDRFSREVVSKVLSEGYGGTACTFCMGVPSMYERLVGYAEDNGGNYENLRLIASGSAPLSLRLFELIKTTFGKEPVEREGMSETGMNFSNPVRGIKKAGSIGLPMSGVEVRLVNPETLVDMEHGQTGEIWLKGEGISPGYWNRPEENESAFRDGWFRTGDMAKADKDGYYYLTDRIKNIIISGGENVSPKEVESVIARFEGVADSAVVGIEDELWGEMVCAAVVLEQGGEAAPEEIMDFCRKDLQPWKCPKQVIFVDELPRNSMGKVLNDNVKRFFKESRK